jgi:micrococcal nuclease
MKIIRMILAIIAILFTLLLAIVAPWALLGTLLVGFGVYQSAQKRKGRLTFSRPGWFITIGLIFALVITGITADPVEETATETKLASKEEKKEKEEAAKKKEEAEEKAKEKAAAEKKEEEAKAKAKAEEEAKAKAAAAAQQKQLADKFSLEQVTVARAIDGDTLELSDGRKVRLVGVNTPESTTRTEKYGKEASKYTASQLEGKKVWIQKDVSDTDRYSRYLRFIWLQIPTDDMNEKEIRSKMFNAQLVLNGYAEPSTYSPDVKYSEVFKKLGREAREKDAGLWAFDENGTTKGDLDPKKAVATATPSKQSSSSNSSSNTTPAPTPTPAPEPKPAAEPVFYQNCDALRQDHPQGVPQGHPAYASKHDRDKDGYACEIN